MACARRMTAGFICCCDVVMPAWMEENCSRLVEVQPEIRVLYMSVTGKCIAHKAYWIRELITFRSHSPRMTGSARQDTLKPGK